MMLSPFTLTSRSPTEQGEKTVSPQVSGDVVALSCPCGGSQQGLNTARGRVRSCGDPKANPTHGVPNSALRDERAGRQGTRKEIMQDKEQNKQERPWQSMTCVPKQPGPPLAPSSPMSLLTGAQPSLVSWPVLPHALHKDGVHGLQAAPGGTCCPGTEGQEHSWARPMARSMFVPSWCPPRVPKPLHPHSGPAEHQSYPGQTLLRSPHVPPSVAAATILCKNKCHRVLQKT